MLFGIIILLKKQLLIRSTEHLVIMFCSAIPFLDTTTMQPYV